MKAQNVASKLMSIGMTLTLLITVPIVCLIFFNWIVAAIAGLMGIFYVIGKAQTNKA